MCYEPGADDSEIEEQSQNKKLKKVNEPEAVTRRRLEINIDTVNIIKSREKPRLERMYRLAPLGGGDKIKSYSKNIF